MKLSFSGAMENRIRQVNDFDLSEVSTLIETNQKSIERLNFEQYQELKTWFARCISKFPFLEERRVKLLSLDESGRHRLVCNFIGPIYPPREIATPRFAARMVSLLPFWRPLQLVGSSWTPPFATCLQRQGDAEAHAVLLGSLLLGWGLGELHIEATNINSIISLFSLLNFSNQTIIHSVMHIIID